MFPEDAPGTVPTSRGAGSRTTRSRPHADLTLGEADHAQALRWPMPFISERLFGDAGRTRSRQALRRALERNPDGWGSAGRFPLRVRERMGLATQVTFRLRSTHHPSSGASPALALRANLPAVTQDPMSPWSHPARRPGRTHSRVARSQVRSGRTPPGPRLPGSRPGRPCGRPSSSSDRRTSARPRRPASGTSCGPTASRCSTEHAVRDAPEHISHALRSHIGIK